MQRSVIACALLAGVALAQTRSAPKATPNSARTWRPIGAAVATTLGGRDG